MALRASGTLVSVPPLSHTLGSLPSLLKIPALLPGPPQPRRCFLHPPQSVPSHLGLPDQFFIISSPGPRMKAPRRRDV